MEHRIEPDILLSSVLSIPNEIPRAPNCMSPSGEVVRGMTTGSDPAGVRIFLAAVGVAALGSGSFSGSGMTSGTTGTASGWTEGGEL
jgi:hypothetical protein